MRKKLIEVALPLDAINAASARETSSRHGHPSTLHLWWARRPLAGRACGDLRATRPRAGNRCQQLAQRGRALAGGRRARGARGRTRARRARAARRSGARGPGGRCTAWPSSTRYCGAPSSRRSRPGARQWTVPRWPWPCRGGRTRRRGSTRSICDRRWTAATAASTASRAASSRCWRRAGGRAASSPWKPRPVAEAGRTQGRRCSYAHERSGRRYASRAWPDPGGRARRRWPWPPPGRSAAPCT